MPSEASSSTVSSNSSESVSQSGAGVTQTTGRQRSVWLRVLPEAVTLIACGVLYLRTLDLRGTSQGPGPAMYPRVLIALLAVTMVLVIVGQVRTALRGRGDSPISGSPSEEETAATLPLSRIAQVVALSVGFVVATVYIGWVLATFVFVPLFCWATGKRNLFLTVPLGAGLALGSAYVFIRLVYIALPTGVGVFDEITVRLFIALGIY